MTQKIRNFEAAHQVLGQHVAQHILPGASSVVLKDGVVIDQFCCGLADIERGEALRPDHIHRAFSNTKLVTSTLTLLLHDEGHFGLDDPVRNWLPAFGKLRVLRKNATRIDDTEPLARDITLRDLLSHQSGLSHGVFDPGTLIYKAYHASGVRRPDTTLAQEMDIMASLPLLFQPGTDWEYAMGADVLARIIEIVTGQTYTEVLRQRIFGPLDMSDTCHVMRPEQVARFSALYRGEEEGQPKRPGLHRLTDVPFPDAHIKPMPRTGGVGGLVTTLGDWARLLSHLQGGRLLKKHTEQEMMRDQLPAHCFVHFQMLGDFPSMGFGLGGAVTRGPSALQPNTPAGEFQWGGLAGTHWSVSPATGIANVLMTQRHMGFWNPFWFEYKQKVYEALND